MNKYIFFPDSYDSKGLPKVVFVDREAFGCYMGSVIEQEVLDGKQASYPISRCQPYSDELWMLCMNWIQSKQSLDLWYKNLMTKGLRVGK